MTPSRAIDWQWAQLDALSPQDVYEMLALRERVFIVEQNCLYQDADGRDANAWHLLGWGSESSGKKLIGYARVFGPEARYQEPSIGRIVSAPEVRGIGVGRMIVNEAMRRCADLWPRQVIRIAAQKRLERFYLEFGFVVDGEPYVEDGIEHIDMLWGKTK